MISIDEREAGVVRVTTVSIYLGFPSHPLVNSRSFITEKGNSLSEFGASFLMFLIRN